jgi:hypothetical protein
VYLVVADPAGAGATQAREEADVRSVFVGNVGLLFIFFLQSYRVVPFQNFCSC